MICTLSKCFCGAFFYERRAVCQEAAKRSTKNLPKEAVKRAGVHKAMRNESKPVKKLLPRESREVLHRSVLKTGVIIFVRRRLSRRGFRLVALRMPLTNIVNPRLTVLGIAISCARTPQLVTKVGQA
jgi:hypothetical protein